VTRGVYPRASVEERFWRYVTKGDGCWEWTGTISSNGGYGWIKSGGIMVKAHRFAYRLLVGPIPAGMFVCHHCDNPSCVRPDHLFLGTPADNSHDRDAKGRGVRGERQHSARLTADQVREIRELSPSIPGTDLAKRYGVAKSSISAVRNGRTWKWVS